MKKFTYFLKVIALVAVILTTGTISVVQADRSWSPPPEAGQAGKFLQTNGTTELWAAAGGGSVTSITGNLSVATTPSPITTTGTVQLVNDVVSPGNSAYYGTNSGGTRGWFALSGAISPAGSIGDIQIAGMGGVFAAVSGFNISGSSLSVPRDLILGFTGGAGRLLQMEANSSGSGTDFTIKGSNGNGVSSDGGNLVFVAGTKGGIGGIDGRLYLRDPSSGNNALLDTSSMISGHTYTFPDHGLIFDNITNATTTSITGLLKGGAGVISAATAGTDYLISVNTDTTLTGSGTSGSPLGINLTNGNIWTGTQNFKDRIQISGAMSGKLALIAPVTVTDYDLVLPLAQGAANTAMVNNGSGFLSWTGVSSSAATPVNLTAQTAAVTATTLFTPATTGQYRVSVYLQVTTAASISSVLGGATGVTLTYNDGDGNVAQTDTVALMNTAGGIAVTSSTNSTATNLNGTVTIYARAGVPVQFAIGYTSAGTAMQYAAHLRAESI